jgi:hypothetical protein
MVKRPITQTHFPAFVVRFIYRNDVWSMSRPR